MKPRHYWLTISVRAQEEQFAPDGEGVNITHQCFEIGAGDVDSVLDVLNEMVQFQEEDNLVAWALKERFLTLCEEMEDDPQQEAALLTLFGRAS